jgi:hypothetical protein
MGMPENVKVQKHRSHALQVARRPEKLPGLFRTDRQMLFARETVAFHAGVAISGVNRTLVSWLKSNVQPEQ